MTDSKSAREWWIYSGTKGWIVRQMKNTDAFSDGIHVIEHSAYEKMQFERDSLQIKLSILELDREMSALTNTKDIFRGEKIVQLLEACEIERDRLHEALKGLSHSKQEPCFCDVAVGHPLMSDHSTACKFAQEALK